MVDVVPARSSFDRLRTNGVWAKTPITSADAPDNSLEQRFAPQRYSGLNAVRGEPVEP
jgi:hypothetical protein